MPAPAPSADGDPLSQPNAPTEDLQKTPREILVIKPSSLGDVVHTLPAVAQLKRRWPAARLRWLINPEWAPLLKGNPHVDEVVMFPRGEFRGLGGVVRVLPWARELRRRVRADLVLDFQGLLRSALLAKLCCANGGRIFGLSDAREGARFFYDQVVNVTGRTHAVDRYLALIAALGLTVEEPLSWPLPRGDAPGAELPQRYVLLHPFARGAGKSLTIEQVQEFCRELAPCPVVIVGHADAELPRIENVVNLLNRTTLHELIFTIRRAAFVVSVDSGPMHIAAAITSRLVSIHTWSDPLKVGPFQPGAWVWQQGKLSRVADLRQRGEGRSVPDAGALAAFVRSQTEVS